MKETVKLKVVAFALKIISSRTATVYCSINVTQAVGLIGVSGANVTIHANEVQSVVKGAGKN